MRVTILGSGTAVPVPDRFPSGVLITHESHVVLVDLGPGTLRRLAAAGVTPDRITAILLTHYHTDHTADLAALLFALRNPNLAHRPPLPIYGNTGLLELLANLTAAWPWLASKDYELRPTVIGPGTFPLDALTGDAPLTVTAVAIEHTAASLAYRIEAPDGAAVALSGDADECPGLAEVAKGTDLFICEAAFPDGAKVAGHITPSMAGAAAAAAGTRRLCLTHFYPECDGHDLVAQARSTYPGEVVLAEDLMEFDLAASPKG